MISLGAVFVRAALRAYTYPYRKRFASLSRSVALKEKPYEPPKGFAFAQEEYGGVRVEKIVPPECGDGAVLQFHGGGPFTASIIVPTHILPIPPCMTSAFAPMRRSVRAYCGAEILSPSGIASVRTCSCPPVCGQERAGFRCRLRSSASPALSIWRLPGARIGRIVIGILFTVCRGAMTLKRMKKRSAASRPIAAVRP